jgi:predicted ester cyclase
MGDVWVEELEEPEMSHPELAQFYARYIAAINARKFDIVAEMVHDDVLLNGAPYKRADVLASLKGIADAVPDFKWNVQDLFVVDDRIAARSQNTGTPTKTFLGQEATGAYVNFMEFGAYKIRDGRFAEMWFLLDAATVATQLRATGNWESATSP